MACLETKLSNQQDSEREEGEIVDDIDVLSDISSEEENLLRERLAVLENYNNVLERKKAKDSSLGSDVCYKASDQLIDLSDISISELDEIQFENRRLNIHKHNKSRKRSSRKTGRESQKVRKDAIIRSTKAKPRNSKRKPYISRQLQVKIISESSEESEDEYRNKRRRLADAIAVTNQKNDTSSLKARLNKFLFPSDKPSDTKISQSENLLNHAVENTDIISISDSSENHRTPFLENSKQSIQAKESNEIIPNINAVPIDLCQDEESKTSIKDGKVDGTEDAAEKQKEAVDNNKNETSDDDLEQLRQHALKTKATKTATNVTNSVTENKLQTLSENEDSDTRELRLICLKSAILKKAIEMKMKQKKRKRLSQTLNLHDDLLADLVAVSSKPESNNNTDIESVDMDIGSDADEKSKDNSNSKENLYSKNESDDTNMFTMKIPEDELEEDEDLLRAKLLTSLSKNLPHLVDPKIADSFKSPEKEAGASKTDTKEKVLNIPDAKKLIINLGESDSEGEHEATKNLTKMHVKLSESVEFQQNLDIFLKSTRKEVEKKLKLPDVVQPEPVSVPVPKSPKKFVAKAVNHLPKSEQIEYKKLVKRMDELEKMKQIRQCNMNLLKKGSQLAETLKPRNVTIDSNIVNNNLEEQIALSRKNIAEESAKMLKLKEEGTKLSQKYKIVATELRNLATAINLNKKEQRTVQNKLSKIRNKHQMLIKSTSINKHSKNGHMLPSDYKVAHTKLQKENNPAKKEYKNPQILKSVKVSVVNDRQEELVQPGPRLSIEVDVTSNKKTVTVPKTGLENLGLNQTAESKNHTDRLHGENLRDNERLLSNNETKTDREVVLDDYKSPLQALETVSWAGDPNNILCPFDFGGNCKDVDCKYEHPLSSK